MSSKTKFSEKFFSRRNAKTYYFYGFMLGDGSLIYHKQGHKYLTLTLDVRDENILHKFCEWTEKSTTNIKKYRNGKTVRLDYYGTKLFSKNYSKFGLVPNKTNNPTLPQIEEKFLRPFLIGLIDADGSISFDTPRKNLDRISKEYNFNIVGHPLIMNWFVDQIQKLGFTGKINSQIIKGKWKRIRIQRKNDILQLAKILRLNKYYHLCLERKWKNLNFYDYLSSCSIRN